MTLLAATILGEVQERTGRGTTIADIDDELAMILQDLCVLGPVLQSSASVVVAASSQTAALPSDYRSPIAVLDSAGTPLDILGLKTVLARQRVETAEGTPERVGMLGMATLYVHPIPSAQTTLTLLYAGISSTLSDFPDEFKLTIIEGVCWQMYERLGLMGKDPAGADHKGAYDERAAVLIARYQGAIG
jgi:hypothetical protein